MCSFSTLYGATRVAIFAVCCAAATYAASPALFYSDLDSGPKSGGEANRGVYVCVSGRSFGAAQGESTITVGGVEAARYAYWGTTGVNGAATDKACFQMGSSTPLGAQTIVLTVGGVQSNPLPFTVRPEGRIYCVDAQHGSDSNDGRYSTDAPAGGGCKATLSKGYSLLGPGDTLFVHSGEYTTNPGSSAVLFLNGSGREGLPKAISGYPGASMTVGLDVANGGPTYGIRGAGDGYPCDFHTIANLQSMHGQESAIVLAGCENVRIVGNGITCPNQNSWQGCAGAASVYNANPYILKEASRHKWYGNDVFNVGTSVPATYVGRLIPGPYTITPGVNDRILISVDGGPDQAITLSPCTSCAAAVVAADINSKMTGGTAKALGAGIQLTSGSGGWDRSTLAIKAVPNNAYDLFGWITGQVVHGGAAKYSHSFYWGTNAHDLDFGWNVIRDNNACRGLQMHSSPTGLGDVKDPTGQSLYNIEIHDNLIYNIGCDGLNFGSVDPSLGPVRAYNNILWNIGTGKNMSSEGGFSAVNIGMLHNKVYASSSPECVWSSNGTAVTGSASCRFTTELEAGWSLTPERFPDTAAFGAYRNVAMANVDQHLLYSATIAQIIDDQHLTLEVIPPPYSHIWVGWAGDYQTNNFSNQRLRWIKSGRGEIELYNNTFYSNGNTQAGWKDSAAAYCRSGGAGRLVGKLVNNIIYQTGNLAYACTGQILTGTSTSYSYGDHNLFFSNGTPGAVPPFAQNSILGDPQFVSAASADFHITTSSPAKNAATTAPFLTRDFDGVTRSQSGAVDLGAFESSSSRVEENVKSACDLTGDGLVNQQDVASAINQTIGIAPCGKAAVMGGGSCNVTGVQRVINAAVSGACAVPR